MAYLNHNGGSIELEPANYYNGYRGVYKHQNGEANSPIIFKLDDDCVKSFTARDQDKMLVCRYTFDYEPFSTEYGGYAIGDRITFEGSHWECLVSTQDSPKDAPYRWKNITHDER